jgi:hypothetical protein
MRREVGTRKFEYTCFNIRSACFGAFFLHLLSTSQSWFSLTSEKNAMEEIDLVGYVQREKLLAQLYEHGRSLSRLAYRPINRQPLNVSHTPYEPKGIWAKSYPDINIIGNGKAGTSHIYRILSGHSQVASAHEEKEFCVRSTDVQRLYEYRKSLYSRREELKETQLTVNGCIGACKGLNGCVGGSHEVELNYRYIPSRSEKFMITFRDPADFLWAGFNFWTMEGLDDSEFINPGMWTDATHHYRSPGLFHEIVASNGRVKAFNALFSRITGSTKDALRMMELVGKKNIIFIRSEDIHPTSIQASGVLYRLANFTNIDPSQYGNETMQVTNCNDNKGSVSVCKNASTQGLYGISGRQEMFRSTRCLIYAFCRTDCDLWFEKFNISYPQCRNFAKWC